MTGKKQIPDDSFADLAVALFQEVRHYGQSNERLEILTVRLAEAGLNPDTAARIMDDAESHVRKVAAAYELLRALCVHENEIRAIVARGPRRRRLMDLVRSAAS